MLDEDTYLVGADECLDTYATGLDSLHLTTSHIAYHVRLYHKLLRLLGLLRLWHALHKNVPGREPKNEVSQSAT